MHLNWVLYRVAFYHVIGERSEESGQMLRVTPFHCVLLSMTDSTLDCNLVLVASKMLNVVSKMLTLRQGSRNS